MESNIIIIKEGAELRPKDFLEVIQTWIMIYNDCYKSRFSGRTGRNRAQVKMDYGMLRVASSLYVIKELKGTLAEVCIKKAAKIGKSFDYTRLPEIYRLLCRIEEYMEH